jgi:hypothetical protein
MVPKTPGARIHRVEYALLAAVRSLPACLLAAASLGSALLAVAPARADDPPRFGDAGSLAFGGDLGIGGEQGLDHGYDTRVDLELDPALDVFVVRGLSLGIGSELSYSFARSSPSSSLVSVSPRVGYAVPLGRLYALWPRLSFDVAFAVDTVGVHHRILSSTLFVPVDALLLPHFVVGLGPAVTQQLLDTTPAGAVPITTTLQLLVELAGWL